MARLKGSKLKKEHKRNISESLKGIQHSKEKREKISKTLLSKKLKGNKSSNWKGGLTPINTKIRASTEYKLWRVSVFVRDKYTCVWCRQIGGKLVADHIKPFALFPELRFAIDNGRTLCHNCHLKTATFGGRTRGLIK